MNRDTYTFEERFLAWLTHSSESYGSSLEQDVLSHEGGFEGVGDVTSATLHMHQFEETSPRSSGPEPLKLGAKSVVQERFYALLKQRFQREMEARPPLFPWETELVEYEDAVAIAAWTPQLHQLRLPVALPEQVLATLFERCQELTQTAMKDGRRLVEAVESIFSGEALPLDDLAGRMPIMLATRDGGDRKEMVKRLLGSQIPESYEVAGHQQQVTLAMLAAHEMLNRLTLKLDVHSPVVSRTWSSAAGELQVKAEKGDGLLSIEVSLPEAGSVVAQHGTHTSQSQRQDAGTVNLQLPNVDGGELVALQIRMEGAEAPLGFSIHL